MELLASVIGGAIIIEAYAWLPALCLWIVEKTASFAPAEEQDRCREEWTGTLAGMPNSAFRLVHSLSFILAVWRIRRDFRTQAVEEIDDAIVELSTLIDQAERVWERLAAKMNPVLAKLDQKRGDAEAEKEILPTLFQVNRMLVVYREHVQTFEKHIPRLEAIRTSDHVRYKKWEIAYYETCSDLENDVDAFLKACDE